MYLRIGELLLIPCKIGEIMNKGCYYCEHFSVGRLGARDLCSNKKFSREILNPLSGKHNAWGDPRKLNASLDCKEFTEKIGFFQKVKNKLFTER